MRFICALAFFFSLSVTASTQVNDLLLTANNNVDYQYNPPGFEVCENGETTCQEVGADGRYILVKADGGAMCPAGYYFLLDSVAKEVLPVTTKTCDPTVVLTLAKSKSRDRHLIVIEERGEMTGAIELDY